jgi:hypothetical protein
MNCQGAFVVLADGDTDIGLQKSAEPIFESSYLGALLGFSWTAGTLLP